MSEYFEIFLFLFLQLVPLMMCIFLSSYAVDAQARRLRVRPYQAESEEESIDDESELTEEYDDRPQTSNEYFKAVSSNDDYNGLYGRPTTPTSRSRASYIQPKSSTATPRTKDTQTKAPPVQTIRNYSKVNDDGSFTFGYEAADGSFKEETRGTDCVVRGKYGYVDPDGNKREFTYVSGNPCDPNHPDENEEPDRSEENLDEPENVPQNYPSRPIRPVTSRTPLPQQQHFSRQTTTHAPTTVFQNQYSSSSAAASYQESAEDEQPEPIQLLQPQSQQQRVTVRPQLVQHQLQSIAPDEVTIRQRPRLTVANTTPIPVSYKTPTRTSHPVSITPRPTYRVPQQSLQTQLPATTYRPNVQFVTQKAAAVTYSPTPSSLTVEPLTKTAYANVRKPIDFAVEFQKFQQEHNVVQQQSTTPRILASQRPFKPSPIQQAQISSPTSNPIYQSQLVFDPKTGQYDSALFQQLPQSDGDLILNNRHQPYQHQPQFNLPQSLVSIEQLEQRNQQPIYSRPASPVNIQASRTSLQYPNHFSQQVYQKDQENSQVLNSQQLYAQQQELQLQQLHKDRIEAANRKPIPTGHPLQQHRFQNQPQLIRQELLPQQQSPQGFYFVQQPGQSTGQIDEFLRGHNLDFN